MRVLFWEPAWVSLFRWAFRSSPELDFPCLGVFVALHAHRLPGPFPGASVGRGSLATDGKPSDVACSSIAPNRLQTFQISLNIASQIPFDQQSAPVDCVNNLTQLFGRQILCPHVWVYIRLLKDLFGGFWPDTVNVR